MKKEMEKTEKVSNTRKNIFYSIGLLVLLTIVVLGTVGFKYLQSPKIELNISEEIEDVVFSEDGEAAHIKLNITDDLNITKIKFVFKSSSGNEYVFETTEINYNQTINLEDIEGLDNFENIKEIRVIFEYEGEEESDDESDSDVGTGPIGGKNGGGGSDDNRGGTGYEVPIINPKYISDEFDLTDNVLILYNENTLDGLEIAQYYATARNINFNQRL